MGQKIYEDKTKGDKLHNKRMKTYNNGNESVFMHYE